MRRRVEQLLPVLVLVASVSAAVLVSLLLSSTRRQGVEALEQAALGEVRAIAASQDQRFASTFEGAASFANPPGEPFELTLGSPLDTRRLEELLALVPDLRSGFYLVDATDRITSGANVPAGVIGSQFSWPGYDELLDSEQFAEGAGGVLPVGPGVTTDEAVDAFVFPIRSIDGELRGAFVFESVVSPDSDFNAEVRSLRRGDTGEYLFVDQSGAVIASNEDSLIGNTLSDDRYLTAPLGVQRFDDRIVVLADMPSAGWRIAFRQDETEFERGLARPLESAGRIVVLSLLAAGALATLLLHRRLRAATAEQERLQRLSEAQQEFISIVSHELRTPVSGVLGFLETSLDHWGSMSDDDRRVAVGRAAANARRLQAMTRDVLDSQAVERGALEHVLVPIDLAAEAASAVEAARSLADGRTIELRLPGAPLWVQGDADRLQQVLANLIDNAQKNSPAVEPIEVEVRAVGHDAEVRVSDHGPGLAPESVERIFDKFVRGRGESVSGTGLGLYISRQVVTAHGGRIWAESPPGGGATFRFTVPLAEVVTT